MIPQGNQLLLFELQIPNRALTMFPLDSGPSPDTHVVHYKHSSCCAEWGRKTTFFWTHTRSSPYILLYMYTSLWY